MDETQRAIFTAGLRATYFDALEGNLADISTIADSLQTTNIQEIFGWTDFLPEVKKFTGDIVEQQIGENKFTVNLEEYELSIVAAYRDIEAGKIASYNQQARGGGREIGRFPAAEAYGLLADGFTETGYDGKPYFSATHNWGGEVVSNLGTTALSEASLAETITRIRRVKKVNGTPGFNAGARYTLVVPPELEKTALGLTTAQLRGGGNTNEFTLLTQIQVLVNDYQTRAKDWILYVNNAPTKPIVSIVRKQEDLNEIDDKRRRRTTYNSYIDMATTFGLWQVAYGHRVA